MDDLEAGPAADASLSVKDMTPTISALRDGSFPLNLQESIARVFPVTVKTVDESVWPPKDHVLARLASRTAVVADAASPTRFPSRNTDTWLTIFHPSIERSHYSNDLYYDYDHDSCKNNGDNHIDDEDNQHDHEHEQGVNTSPEQQKFENRQFCRTWVYKCAVF